MREFPLAPGECVLDVNGHGIRTGNLCSIPIAKASVAGTNSLATVRKSILKRKTLLCFHATIKNYRAVYVKEIKFHTF